MELDADKIAAYLLISLSKGSPSAYSLYGTGGNDFYLLSAAINYSRLESEYLRSHPVEFRRMSLIANIFIENAEKELGEGPETEASIEQLKGFQRYQKEYDEALQKVYNIYQDSLLDSLLDYFSTYSDSADFYWKQGDWASATRYYQKSLLKAQRLLSLSDSFSDKLSPLDSTDITDISPELTRTVAWMQYGIGLGYINQAKGDSGLPYLKSALEYFQSQNTVESQESELALLNDIAVSYIKQAKGDSALIYLNHSFPLAKKLNDEQMIGTVLNN